MLRTRSLSLAAIPAALVALVGLNACSLWRSTYTLSPAVQESARRYSEVMDDFADQALLANVLRAKDHAPMNFNDLGSITGSLSMSGTLGLTLPFGPYNGDKAFKALGAAKYTASPSITTSTSPLVNISTLNTQGFMMTMIQPVSATYVLSKWDSYPHELLLYLFVKSIRFPDEEDSPAQCSPVDAPKCSKRVTHRNDPDNETDFRDFQLLVSQMTSKAGGNVDMKALTLLDPLGVPIPIGRTITSTVPIPTPNPTTNIAAPDHPTLHGVALAGTPTATYFVRLTFVTSAGESAVSAESQISLPAGQGISVEAPVFPSTPTPIGYNVYVATASGAETRQNPKPVLKDTSWQMTSPALLVGAPPPAYSGTQYQVQSDYNIFQVINGLSDGQLHVGNKHCPENIKAGVHADDLCPPGEQVPFAQFYKEYFAQVVLCVHTDDCTGLLDGHQLAPMTEKEKRARRKHCDLQVELDSLNNKHEQQANTTPPGEPEKSDSQFQSTMSALMDSLAVAGAEANTSDLKALMGFTAALKPPSSSSGASASPSPAGGGAPQGGGGASGGTSAAGAMPQVTLALQPSRISAMVHNEACNSDQIVLHPTTERQFERENAKFTHIQWRSIAEVIQYLGAIARYQDHHAKAKPQFVQWGAGDAPSRILTYRQGSAGQVSTYYRRQEYSSPMEPIEGATDYSLQSLALLNELISIAKISGSLPVTQPVQVLP